MQAQQLFSSDSEKDEVLWDWWFVWASGTSPSREVVYIDSLSVEKVVDHAAIMTMPGDKKVKSGEKKENGFPIDYVQADGYLISEDPNKPAKHATRIFVKCNAQKIMFDTSYKTYWDTDRGVETEPASPWLDSTSHIRYSQIAKFMCEPKARNEKNMMMRVDQSSDPLDRTWAVFWPDAKKPEFTTKKSREQIDTEYAAIKGKAETIITTSIADETKRLEGYDKEGEFMASVRTNFQSKDKGSQKLFAYMPGWHETQINTAWGPPRRSGWDGETRFLVYPYQDTVYDQVQVPVDIMGCQGYYRVVLVLSEPK